MQRKNDILMPLKSTASNKTTLGYTLSFREHFSSKNIPYAQAKRRGFALIMVVVVMIIVSTITMFTLMQTSQTIKRTADMYLYEQAELYTKSAAEYALFKIARDGCQDNLNLQLPEINPIYDINISMRYSYVGGAPAGCTSYATVTTPEQNGSVLMDITVNVSAANTGSDPLRYFKRTIQKL